MTDANNQTPERQKYDKAAAELFAAEQARFESSTRLKQSRVSRTALADSLKRAREAVRAADRQHSEYALADREASKRVKAATAKRDEAFAALEAATAAAVAASESEPSPAAAGDGDDADGGKGDGGSASGSRSTRAKAAS